MITHIVLLKPKSETTPYEMQQILPCPGTDASTKHIRHYRCSGGRKLEHEPSRIYLSFTGNLLKEAPPIHPAVLERS
jgi:hypothetical protein